MMSGRIALQTLKLANRNLVCSTNLAKSLIRVPRIAQFSTSLYRKNSTTQELNSVLANEIKFEEEDSFGLDLAFKTYLEDQQIEIANTDGKVLAELVKKTPNELIHIYFDVLRISQVSYSLKQMQEELEEHEFMEQDISELSFTDVNVVIEKDNKAIGFDLSLSLVDFSFTVSGITHFDDINTAVSESAEANSQRDLKYSGPQFNNLAEELQDAIGQYLNSRGIDSNLGEFILAYSGVKENNEYLDWLHNLKEFTN